MDQDSNHASPDREREAEDGARGPASNDPSIHPAATGGTASSGGGPEDDPSPSAEAAPVVVGIGEHIPAPDEAAQPTSLERLKMLLVGKPRDLADQSVFKHVSLIAFLAWVGLGADGLSSSCYGPAEAFANLRGHYYLAVVLASAIMATVFIISACYSHIIEDFPNGGGYLVASKLLGRRIGVVSGCALLVDYVLTITVSIAAAGGAIFGLLGEQWATWQLPSEYIAIAVLIVLNLRGVKESIQVLLPIFLLFLLTHIVLIVGTIGLHLADTAGVASTLSVQFRAGLSNPELGLLGMISILLYAYSLGAGTYTGIEAVSNSMTVMREPRVATAKRTMIYMAVSLAFTAAGLVVAYLLLGIIPHEGKTMNQTLTERFIQETRLGASWLGTLFLLSTLLSEGALLVVAAQAGFIGGPRVLANMAQDSWLPRWFGNLSDRLATHNGVLLLGILAVAALWYTQGNISVLVIMYSINVFVTFSLSMIGMCRLWVSRRGQSRVWLRRLTLFAIGAVLCISILAVAVIEKFREGGWVTIVSTGVCIGLCFAIQRYYTRVGVKLRALDQTLKQLATDGDPNRDDVDPSLPTAVILVGGYSGLGIHTMLNVVRFIPDHFRNFVFASVGVVDSGNFKGSDAVDDLRGHTEETLQRYIDLARRLGMPATAFSTVGTDAVDELERLCLEIARVFPKSTVFAGQLVFEKDTWVHRLLHNQTAYALQRRLQWAGLPMVILPTRVK